MRIVLTLALLALLAGCTNTGQASVDVEPEEETFQVPTDVSFDPQVWETAGTELRPAMRLAEGAATRDLEVSFEYVGDGTVTVPQGGTVAAGSDTIEPSGPFVARTPSRDVQGTVRVSLSDAETGAPISSAEWTVLLRESIVSDIQTIRTAPMSERDYFACFVAVQYDPMRGGMVAPQDRDEHVELIGSIERQGGFNPAVRVLGELDPSVFQRMPLGFEDDENRRVFFVSVEEPSFPPVRRAYLTLEARCGGDTHKSYVALPNR